MRCRILYTCEALLISVFITSLVLGCSNHEYYVSVLIVVPHDSTNKNNWEVLLIENQKDNAALWSCFLTVNVVKSNRAINFAAGCLCDEGLFDKVFSMSFDDICSYIKTNTLYEFICASSISHMYVIPLSNSAINRYLTGFYDALYHRKKMLRSTQTERHDSPNRLALVSWSELLHNIALSKTGNNIKVKAKLASKRVRASKKRPYFDTLYITIDPLLWNQLKYIATKMRYTKGERAGIRLYT